METTPYWKKIWLTITGGNKNVTSEDATKVLKLVGNDLCSGILQYTPYTPKSFTEWKSAVDLKDKDKILETFICRLSIYLDLETSSAWKVFCNFLMFEYYGKVADIKRIAQYEMYAKHLFQHIWFFYSFERMFLIKTLKHILGKSLDKEHEFHDIYADYCTSHLQNIRDNLFKQFSYLLNEIHGENISHCTDFGDWVDRNVREQIEILSSLIITVKHLPLSIEEYKSFLQLIREHNFGSDPKCFQASSVMNPINLSSLKAIEHGLLLIGFMPYWENPEMWVPHGQELEKLFTSIFKQGDYPVILLAWATLQMTLPEKVAEERFNNYYHKFTKHALEQNVFISLYEISSNHLLQNCKVGKMIKTAIYTLLHHVCDLFNGDGILLTIKQSDYLIADLLTVPELAQHFIHSSGHHAASIYENATVLFPITFDSFTIIVNALLQYPEVFKAVTASLMQLKYFTEELNGTLFDDNVTVLADYRPNDSTTIIVPAKSEAMVFHHFNRVLVTYKINFTYFDVLEDLVNEVIVNKHPPAAIKNSICLGFKLIKIQLEKSTGDLIPLRRCINMVSAVFGKFTKRPMLDFKLIDVCVDIYIELLEVHETQIMEILAVNNFLPDIMKDPLKVENYFDKTFFAPGVLFMAIQDEITAGDYDLLFALIRLFKNAIHKNNHHLKIQIPSVILLFVHVFPLHLDWNYKNIHRKNQLTHECIQILFDILQQNYTSLNTAEDKTIYNFCYELITNYEPFLKVFVRLFLVPNVYLHAHMEKEFDWDNISDMEVIKIVKTCLSIVLLLFNKHSTSPKNIFKTPFSLLLFKTDSKPSMLKIVAGHINHAFDKSIPKFACQLLKKFASYSELPVLSLLEMDCHQIQCMFLEKLRDPLEDDNMKVLILELVTLCIEKQNGMTAAFFNVSPAIDNAKDGESILTFMEEYLENIRESADYLRSPIQTAVLDLFHKLWMFKKDILIRDLIKQEKFWLTLADPLFQNLTLSNRTYSQIYNILTFEIFKSKGDNVKIKELLVKMFVENKYFVTNWTKHILESLEGSSNINYSVQLLISWKNALTAINKFCPNIIENHATRHMLTQNCLDGLIQYFLYPDDVRILAEWAELYLYLMTVWPTSYYKDCKIMFSTLTKVFKHLGDHYDNIVGTYKETLLSIAIKTIQDLQKQLLSNPLLVDDYLYSLGKIFEKEYIRIMTIEEQERVNTGEKTYSNWLLLLVFSNKLLQSGFAESRPAWFRLIQFLNKILSSIGPFIKNPSCFPIAKLSVQCLINYAQSPLLRDFLFVDLETFFDLTRPPKRYINTQELSFKNATPWYFEEWWLTYSGIVQLMTVLVRHFGHFKLDMFFSFIYIHEDVLKNSLMLPMVTAELTALQLVSGCLNFCHALLRWRPVWKINHTHLYFTYLQSINVTINAVCRIFIRPRILKFFTIDKESKLTLVEKVPLNFIVAIMNLLMEVLGLCNICLIKSSTDLIALLEPTKPSVVDDIGIEYDFHVPKIYEEHPEQLNYGTVLCILHFLCKTISQINLSKSPNTSDTNLDETETGFIAFVCPDFVGGYTISEKYNSVQTFAASEISGMSAPWLTKLDVRKVNFAIETLNTFLASQIFLTMHMRKVIYYDLQYIKRELCSELLFFHEFIRKRMVEQRQYRVVENTVFRKSLAISLPYYVSASQREEEIIFTRKITLIDVDEDNNRESLSSLNNIMRIHGHLKELEATAFYKPNDFQEIYTDEDMNVDSNETPRLPFRKIFYGTRTFKDGCIIRIPIEKTTLRYPPGPPIVSGDYLLLLSHWFIFICNLSH